MEDGFRFADEFGPAKILHVYEPSIDLHGILVVDNVAAGPSIGGLRMATDVSLEECSRLARAMTWKNAAAGLRHGGGKSVLFGDPSMPPERKEKLIRAFACAIRDVHDYIIGPDMGTNEQCMAWAHDETGRAVGLPREIGGIPLDEIGATGWGIRHATEVALEHCEFSLSGARVAVQGFGAVGMHAARFLVGKGAVLVATCDQRGGIYDPNGLDVEKLIQFKAKSSAGIGDFPSGERIDPDAVIDVACEIWIPAARPDVVHEDNMHRLRTKLVVEGANIPITPAAETSLHERGVLCIPDFIANAGGVICAAMEYARASETAAMETVAEKIRRNTDEVLSLTQKEQITPRAAALELAEARVRRAMRTRRWSVF